MKRMALFLITVISDIHPLVRAASEGSLSCAFYVVVISD